MTAIRTRAKTAPAKAKAHTRLQRARLWAARLTLAGRLISIHKELWIPALVTIAPLVTFGVAVPTFAAANIAAWFAWSWRHSGAYRRNAEDTMAARFTYRWATDEINDPTNTPHLVAVDITRATRPEARHIRNNQGRHALGALGMTLTIRPKPNQLTRDWTNNFEAATRLRYGFQSSTDPIPSKTDINAVVVTFGQDRMPTVVRATTS